MLSVSSSTAHDAVREISPFQELLLLGDRQLTSEERLEKIRTNLRKLVGRWLQFLDLPFKIGQ